MSNARLNAIAAVTNYEATGAALDFSKTPATDLFGSNVFNDKVMQERLPSASSTTQNDGAAASLTSVPPAARTAWTRASASSTGTQTSRCQRCDGDAGGSGAPSSLGSWNHIDGA